MHQLRNWLLELLRLHGIDEEIRNGLLELLRLNGID